MSASKALLSSLTSFSRSSSEIFERLMSSESAHRWSSSLKPVCLPLCRYFSRRCQRLAQFQHALLALGGVGVENLVDLLLERVEVLGASLVVHPCDDRGGEVQDLLELLGRHVEQVADAAGHALEEPDVADRRGQVDVAHALATDLRARDLHAAALAHDALVAHALVLAAVALPVLGGTEDALAEETVLLGLERAVVDRLGLGHLARAPGADLLGGGEADLDGVEVVDVDHLVPFRSWVKLNWGSAGGLRGAEPPGARSV